MRWLFAIGFRFDLNSWDAVAFFSMRNASLASRDASLHSKQQVLLTQAIFDEMPERLEARRLLLRSGTIVHAAIIAAPSLTKHASASPDPEMKQTHRAKLALRDEAAPRRGSTRDRPYGAGDLISPNIDDRLKVKPRPHQCDRTNREEF